MNTQAKTLEELVCEYCRRKLAVREDPGLSWEQKERQVKQLGDEYYRARRRLEGEAA
jgi:hypothetical protein